LTWKVEPAVWGGFILRLSVSPRLEEWWAGRSDKKRHLWLDSVELDDLGTHLLFSRPIADKSDDTYAALCSWRDVPAAAADLRFRRLGPALMKAYGSSIFLSTVDEIAQAFQLEERHLNSTEVPGRCRLKWGHLLRFSGQSVPAVLDYLNLEKPEHISLPILIKPGANLALVLAFSSSAEEPLRIGICCQWKDGLAIDDLGAWLRTFPPSKNPETRLEIRWAPPGRFSSLDTPASEEAIAL
jgi:hypothetical protein